MSINYSQRLGTYVAQDTLGQVVGIYSPAAHGTVDEFRNAMSQEGHA